METKCPIGAVGVQDCSSIKEVEIVMWSYTLATGDIDAYIAKLPFPEGMKYKLFVNVSK